MTFGEWRPSAAVGAVERYIDGEGSLIHRQIMHDPTDTLERAKRIRNDTDGRTRGGGRLIAKIPIGLYHIWLMEWTAQGRIAPGQTSGVNDLIKEKLRDSDYAYLRCTNGGI